MLFLLLLLTTSLPVFACATVTVQHALLHGVNRVHRIPTTWLLPFVFAEAGGLPETAGSVVL